MNAKDIFQFTIDLTVSNTLKPSDLLVINSIGFALIVLSLSGRLNYIFSETYHNNQAAVDMGYPVLIFVNRISYWGMLFVLSLMLQICTFFNIFEPFKSILFNLSFLLTSFGFIALFWFYIVYLFGSRLLDILAFRRWITS